MKKNNRLLRLLCLVLSLGATLSLCGCPAGTPPDQGGGSTTTTTTGGTGGNGGGGQPPVIPVYPNGTAVTGAGDRIDEGSPALTANEAGAAPTAVTGDAFAALLTGATVAQGTTYQLSDEAAELIAPSNKTYDAKGAVLMGDLTLSGTGSKVTLKNLTVFGSVTVSGPTNVLLENVQIFSEGTALTVAAASEGVELKDARIEATVGVNNAASGLFVHHSVLLFTEKGVVDTGLKGTMVRDCRLTGGDTALVAVTSAAADSQVMYNTVVMPKDATGVAFTGVSVNRIAAMNSITGAQNSVSVKGTRNTVVLLNQVTSIEAEGARNLYICENNFGGRLVAKNNDYFLAEANVFAAGDGLWRENVDLDNTNTNGDTLMDVDARLEVGADPDLLPHVDRDLFICMDRYETVPDPDRQSLALPSYVNKYAKEEDFIILMPGAYKSDSEWSFAAAAKDTTIYGYGVYAERQSGLGKMVRCTDTQNVVFKGVTFGYKQQSCGQVYVLEKIPSDGSLRVITGAGMMNEFGNSNRTYYSTTSMGAQREGTFYAYCDTNFISIGAAAANGTRIMRVAGNVYEMIAPGDILTCRANNGSSFGEVTRSTGVEFRDVTIYGSAAGVAFYENRNRDKVLYYRVANTTRSGEIISEELYNKYRDLENTYNVSLEVYYDAENELYRGSPAHIGSIDATHVTDCAIGSTAISCLFENMCDDGTNQHGLHSRLHNVEVEGNIATLYYKNNISYISYNSNGNRTPNFSCADFKEGDRVYIYTSRGQLVCDTPALSVAVSAGSITTEYGTSCPVMKVEVDARDVHLDAIQGINLNINAPTDYGGSPPQVIVDNMSMMSNYFTFDNTMVRNIRSRALLIKASGGQITNCTFENIGMACIAVLYELQWGESGVSENLKIERNLIDHAGFFAKYDGNPKHYAPISLQGLGASADEDYLLNKDISIVGNVVRNRTTDFAVYLKAGKNITFRNNDFGSVNEYRPDCVVDVRIEGAANVEFSDNIYSRMDLNPDECISGTQYKNIFGTDVVFEGIQLLPDNYT